MLCACLLARRGSFAGVTCHAYVRRGECRDLGSPESMMFSFTIMSTIGCAHQHLPPPSFESPNSPSLPARQDLVLHAQPRTPSSGRTAEPWSAASVHTMPGLGALALRLRARARCAGAQHAAPWCLCACLSFAHAHRRQHLAQDHGGAHLHLLFRDDQYPRRRAVLRPLRRAAPGLLRVSPRARRSSSRPLLRVTDSSRRSPASSRHAMQSCLRASPSIIVCWWPRSSD